MSEAIAIGSVIQSDRESSITLSRQEGEAKPIQKPIPGD